jgi:hypothetical protein
MANFLHQRNSAEEWEYPFLHTTAKVGFMRTTQEKSKRIFRRHFQHPDEENRAANERLWLAKLDKIIQAVDGDAEFIIELDEQMNFWYAPHYRNARVSSDHSKTTQGSSSGFYS